MSEKASTKKPTTASPEEIQWIREYKLHQENILYSRVNIFIVVLSIFVAIFGATIQSGSLDSRSHEFAYIVLVLAVLLTAFWFSAVHRQNVILIDLRSELKEKDLIYKNWKAARDSEDRNKKLWRRPISGQFLLIYGLPGVFAVFWAVSFFWLLGKS